MLIVPQIENFRDQNPLLYESFRSVIKAINNSAIQANVDPVKPAAEPVQIDSISVTAGDGIFDIAIVDTSDVQKGIYYFAESDTDPGFPNPHVYFMGSSRNLRTYLGNQTLYWRGYSQYVGSDASTPRNFGDPTAVVGGGSAGPAPAPSQGSGSSDSTSGGGGFGGSGCSEVGTPLEFYPGAQPTSRERDCEDWVDLELHSGRKVSFARGSLVSVFLPVEQVMPGMRVETRGGAYSKLKKTSRSKRKSRKQKVTEPVHRVYLANGVRAHNKADSEDVSREIT